MSTVLSRFQPILDALADVDFDIEAVPGEGATDTEIAAYNTKIAALEAKLPAVICQTQCVVDFLQCLKDNPGGWGYAICYTIFSNCLSNCGGTV